MKNKLLVAAEKIYFCKVKLEFESYAVRLRHFDHDMLSDKELEGEMDASVPYQTISRNSKVC